MAKKGSQTGRQVARTCGLRGCVGLLSVGRCGCDNERCTNHHKKWTALVHAVAAVLPGPGPVDDRAALLAAIKARKAKK